MEVKTELGKIFCKYNESKDDYDVKRVIKFVKDDSNNNIITIVDCNDKYTFDDNSERKDYTLDEYTDLKKNWVELKSDGIISKSNVLSITAEEFGVDVKDIVMLFFPNGKTTNIPDTKYFTVAARQGIENVYASTMNISRVGMSATIDNIPAGYSLYDIISNKKTINSTLMHFYKIDTCKTVSSILDSEDTTTILKDLYEKRIRYLKNTDVNYIEPLKDKEDDCIDGYCNSLKRFLEEVGFIIDIKSSIGISKVDFEMKSGIALSEDDKMLLMTLYGGISICKAVPLEFDYSIDLKLIKMSYIIVEDKNSNLFIVPYTKYPDEVDIASLYKMNQEKYESLQKRLAGIAAHYFDTLGE